MNECADVIIIGGGSAGAVLAKRLSVDSMRRVILVEAGVDTPPGKVPPEIEDSYPMPLFHGERYIWPGLDVVTHRDTQGRQMHRLYEQGRVMGGGSAINVQAANRGLPRDYDAWQALGAKGWGWEDVLPYFRRLETDLDFSGPAHGDRGPIPIRRILPPAWPAFARAAARAFSESGLLFREDQNADAADGVFPPAFSNRDDRRVSTAIGYLTEAVRARPNLRILSETCALGLLVEGTTATGVRVRQRGGPAVTIMARHVVLAAGALQSPALLLRAGIGPGADLRALGIEVAIERAGVGRNLLEHPVLTFCQFLPKRLRLPDSFRRSSLMALRYTSGVEGTDVSDMYVSASARASWHALGRRLALYFLWCNQPYSTGTLRLATPDPEAYPAIDFNLLDDPRDLDRLVAGARFLVRLVVSAVLNPYPEDFFPAGFSSRIRRLSEVSPRNRRLGALLGALLDIPGPLRRVALRRFMNAGALGDALSDDKRMEEFVRSHAYGVWHAAGTCRMGDPRDPGAVVDDSGRVIGSTNIWVGDASVMPRLPTANTNIPTIMIAEKMSDAMAGAL